VILLSSSTVKSDLVAEGAEAISLLDNPHSVVAGLKVLVIDDDPKAAKSLATQLSDLNSQYRITTISETKRMAAELGGDYDVVLLNLQLGDMTGLELLRNNLAGLPPYPIVLLTDDHNPKHQHEALTLGVADFVPKQDARPELLDKSIRYCTNLFKQYRLREQMSAQEQALTTDPNTGLHSLPYCFQQLANMFPATASTELGVIALQLHNISAVNRGLGFELENRIIRHYSQWLKAQLPEHAILASTSNHQLIAIIDGYDEQQLWTLGDRIGRQNVPFDLRPDCSPFALTHSVGIAVATPMITPERLIQNALTALHTSRISRTSCQRYNPELHKGIATRSVVMRDITQALQDELIHFAIQPQFSVATANLLGGEMLMRWKHPELGDVAPQLVIEVAEATKQIVALGTYALRSTLKQIEYWLSQNIILPGMRISVNVSAAELESPGYFAAAKAVLEEYREAAQYLELELTESIKLFDPQKTGRQLSELKPYGVSIAIDDFGTAHANLSQLCYIEANTVKLDKSIIYAADETQRARSIYRSIRKMLHAIGTKIVAEGIETTTQMQLARDIGIDIVQGFFLSEPLSLADFKMLLEQLRDQQQAHIALHGQTPPTPES
jgi:EAL domain-containing protein (putative c-di-GMP-specific phosphodiesterase class I)/PleD family two-component response regulator